MANVQAKKTSRKAGRNLRKPSCQRYTSQMRWLTNKVRKLNRHITAHTNWCPVKLKWICNDKVAIKALKERT